MPREELPQGGSEVEQWKELKWRKQSALLLGVLQLLSGFRSLEWLLSVCLPLLLCSSGIPGSEAAALDDAFLSSCCLCLSCR